MKGIYQITNLRSGKMYVGQSIDIEKRFKDHIYELEHNIHSNRYLQSSWNKYGKSNFVFSMLEKVQEEDNLTSRERYWVDYYGGYESDVLYNLREPGPTGRLSREALDRLSESQKKLRENPEYSAKLAKSLKKSWTPERRKNWSDYKLGTPLSPNHKKKLQEAALKRVGEKRSEEVKSKISEKLKGHPVSEETREKLRQAAKKQKHRSLTEDEKKHLSEKAKENWKIRKCQEVK